MNYIFSSDSENVLKTFVAILPNMLLKQSIDDVTLRMINQIVLRFKEWVREDFTTKQEAIIGKKNYVKIFENKLYIALISF